MFLSFFFKCQWTWEKKQFAHLLLVFPQSLAFCSRRLFLAAPRLPHLLAPAGSITLSLVWLLPLCLRGSSERMVSPLGSWRELAVGGSAGVQWRLCKDGPAHPKSTSSLSLLWSDVIALKTATIIAKVTVGIVMLQSCTKQGQRSTMTSHINNGGNHEVCEKFSIQTRDL